MQCVIQCRLAHNFVKGALDKIQEQSLVPGILIYGSKITDMGNNKIKENKEVGQLEIL